MPIEFPTCTDNPAMMGYGTDTNNAPVLNYNMPVSAELTMYGSARIQFPAEYFVTPPSPFENLPSVDQIKADILYALSIGLASQYIDATAAQLRGLTFYTKVGNDLKKIELN